MPSNCRSRQDTQREGGSEEGREGGSEKGMKWGKEKDLNEMRKTRDRPVKWRRHEVGYREKVEIHIGNLKRKEDSK